MMKKASEYSRIASDVNLNKIEEKYQSDIDWKNLNLSLEMAANEGLNKITLSADSCSNMSDSFYFNQKDINGQVVADLIYLFYGKYNLDFHCNLMERTFTISW